MCVFDNIGVISCCHRYQLIILIWLHYYLQPRLHRARTYIKQLFDAILAPLKWFSGVNFWIVAQFFLHVLYVIARVKTCKLCHIAFNAILASSALFCSVLTCCTMLHDIRIVTLPSS